MSRQLSGFRAWMWQRVSAVYMALYISYLLLHLMIAPPVDREALAAWIGALPMWLASAIFLLMLLLHAWVGVRDVALDYLKPAPLRLLVLLAVQAFLLACGLWALAVLVRLL
ncbi:succinate dehydrogenase, hydrophobic membrane anchor protein [Thiolapillus brandeum]|uniref:Succinate dehydrogenase hydrophobic membrane anchor subunit n=1 Tax=Thiolapillus brandeum TaxID=1076588 RepID=A0A7U6JI25_9GAMM|nr:succinate dehydrogenase, hydrophobic membrane anchor protein [Thiolapillus brandeum]BAO43795.1 succinate dehydrogenase hydrophobic membrane anchor protein [Thiolapillus brandeum]